MKIALHLCTLLLVSSALLLGGCASSTGVQSHGANTYRVEGSSEFGLSGAKNAALEDAAEFCSASNQAIYEVSSRSGAYTDAFGDRVQTWELVFQCTGSPGRTAGPPEYPSRRDEPAPERRDDQQIQAVTREYDRCAGARINDQAVILACSEALRLDPRGTLLTHKARADVYYHRSLAYARLESYERAISDMQMVLRANPQDQEARRLLADMQADRAALYAPPPTYHLYYEGLFCAGLPQDTIVYPASELFLTTAVSPVGNPAGMQTRILPPHEKYYEGVVSGTIIKHGRDEIWSGTDRYVDIAVTLWEHDGELGVAGVIALQVGAALLSRGMSRMGGGYIPPRGTQPVGSPPGQGVLQDPKEEQVGPDEVSTLASLVGGGHDLFGATRFRNVDAAGWSAASLRNYAGIRHHIVSSHRYGGADCRAYFRFAAD